MSTRYFVTKSGIGSIAWNEHGLTRFHLPEENAKSAVVASTLAPPWIAEVIAWTQDYYAGKFHDFSKVPLDWSQVTPFQKKVYLLAQTIPPGQTRTYGELSRDLELGPEGARAIGAALGANPWPLIVPCHRIIAANGKMTGFSAPGGVRTKTRLLALEGAELLSE